MLDNFHDVLNETTELSDSLEQLRVLCGEKVSLQMNRTETTGDTNQTILLTHQIFLVHNTNTIQLFTNETIQQIF